MFGVMSLTDKVVNGVIVAVIQNSYPKTEGYVNNCMGLCDLACMTLTGVRRSQKAERGMVGMQSTQKEIK